ncbi:Subunit of the glycosylphosphatidylinositol transamidase complex-like protein [Orbilia brochopaga]|uniref:Subunit of the glycosylphosphatidylinositol transamidase complex-like protein n=1 Tax=Orbilia brochopaga TaxID=3140254 RepID=A0AAV9UX64_9PEZI
MTPTSLVSRQWLPSSSPPLLQLLSRLLSTLLLFSLAGSTVADTYDETLLLQPLSGQFLLASFNFRSHGPIQAFNKQMFQLFPRSLGQILQYTHTRELHLRFALGRWDSELWGAQPDDGQNAGGTGVELWAWVEADNDVEAEARWTSLNNALSGLFCASLNFIDSTRTIRPVMSFSPTGDYPTTNTTRLFLLHGTLPKEPVCTENLTPFLKLLPCKGKFGISTLLDGHKLFDASFQSMSIDVRPICSATTGECDIEIQQNIDMVLDISRSLQRKDSPVPRPRDQHELICDATKSYGSTEYCYPLDNSFDLPWSLSDLFGKSILGRCPFAVRSDQEVAHVCIAAPKERIVSLPEGSDVTQKTLEDGRRCYTLRDNQPFDVFLPKQEPPTSPHRQEPLLYAERSFTGHGQEHGGVKTVLRNPSTTDAVEVVYLESLPWFMKPYLHTLKAELLPSPPPSAGKDAGKVISELYYRPALDRKRGTQLEAKLVVPPNSVVIMTYDFEKAVLRYTEYPPDANRGFDVASAVITIPPHRRKSDGKFVPATSIRTTSLLLSLPTPDFSMPYNVIIFTSTIMALAFGSIFNLLVRRFVAVDEVQRMNLKATIKGWIGKLSKSKEE